MDVTSYEILDAFFLHPMVLYFRLFEENVHKNFRKPKNFFLRGHSKANCKLKNRFCPVFDAK